MSLDPGSADKGSNQVVDGSMPELAYNFDPFITKEGDSTAKPAKLNFGKGGFPLVNTTQIEEMLNQPVNQDEKLKDLMNVVGIFPRWFGAGNLSYSPILEDSMSPTPKPRAFKTFFTLGDTKKEIELGAAPGFPQVSLGPGEIIIPQVLGRYYGFIDSDGKDLVPKEQQLLELTFDLKELALGAAKVGGQ